MRTKQAASAQDNGFRASTKIAVILPSKSFNFFVFRHTEAVISSRFSSLVRFLSLLSLSVWLGGLALIGLSAPAIFGLNRLLGPRVVAAMLERFSPITLVCGAVLLACWIYQYRTTSTRTRAMKLQGACICAMFLLGSYLALVAAPRIKTLQPSLKQAVLRTEKVVAASGTSRINPTKMTIEAGQFASPQARAEFGKLHGIYGALTSLIVLLGIVVLGISSTRTVEETP